LIFSFPELLKYTCCPANNKQCRHTQKYASCARAKEEKQSFQHQIKGGNEISDLQTLIDWWSMDPPKP
ncbi:Hypothetical predicted protein, partial [Podarcis lilfordi]